MNFWKLSTFVLTGCLGLAVAYGTISSAHAEAQPKMQAALGALEAAKTNLENATADKGGHRANAIAAVKLAIDETKAGIAYDNTHTSKDEKK